MFQLAQVRLERKQFSGLNLYITLCPSESGDLRNRPILPRASSDGPPARPGMASSCSLLEPLLNCRRRTPVRCRTYIQSSGRRRNASHGAISVCARRSTRSQQPHPQNEVSSPPRRSHRRRVLATRQVFRPSLSQVSTTPIVAWRLSRCCAASPAVVTECNNWERWQYTRVSDDFYRL